MGIPIPAVVHIPIAERIKELAPEMREQMIAEHYLPKEYLRYLKKKARPGKKLDKKAGPRPISEFKIYKRSSKVPLSKGSMME